ncbi:sel1 repeat family protein, partial [Salmonella enterica subsp. enterica serovar Kentucky]|nr:sel1 repeat family protein [Salmonella enterica subsp. enterica serovar Kentucky]
KADILHLAELWAQERDPELNFIVGSLYDSGFVEVDDKEARSLQWFRKAAELGQADAQNILGYFYLNGKRGIKRDLQKGVQWYELAAAQ